MAYMPMAPIWDEASACSPVTSVIISRALDGRRAGVGFYLCLVLCISAKTNRSYSTTQHERKPPQKPRTPLTTNPAGRAADRMCASIPTQHTEQLHRQIMAWTHKADSSHMHLLNRSWRRRGGPLSGMLANPGKPPAKVRNDALLQSCANMWRNRSHGINQFLPDSIEDSIERGPVWLAGLPEL